MKNNSPLVVSYYTKDTPYEKETNDLIASCKQFDLLHEISSIANRGSWSANCCFKPQFLLEKLEEHQRPLIWTDIDSAFVQRPTVFDDCHADVALRINDRVAIDDDEKILTQTLFVNNTPSAKKLLQLWKKECEKNLDKQETVLDRVCLRKVVLHYPTIVEMKRLPASYFAIVDSPETKNSQTDGAVVIHRRASKKYREAVDAGLVGCH